MKLIKPSFKIWNQPAGLEGVYKQIEKVGRVCYKSEDKMTEDSAKPFVERMTKSGHGAMLEHGTVYLKVTNKGLSLDNYDKNQVENKYISNPYSKVIFGKYPKYNSYEEKLEATQEVYITTNYRVLVENGWLDDLQYICEPTEFHEKRVTVKFICDRGVSHEFVRHRVMSFAQESTRYCNYSKDKFGNELTFIIPNWLDIPEGNYEIPAFWDKETCKLMSKYAGDENTYASIQTFLSGIGLSEQQYLSLIEDGWKPQQARAILPNALKTELVVTGFVSDWKHFFFLRTPMNAHPQARELAIPLQEEFIERKYINN
jgi:thymidylate synthase (FAD)